MAKKRKKSEPGEGGGRSRTVIALIALALVGLGGYLLLNPQRVRVPELIGKSRQEAEAILAGLKLAAEVKVESPEGRDVPGDTVFGQAPAAGVEVPPRSVVTLYVAEKATGIVLPEVVGKTRSEAEDMLVRLGLQVKFIEASSSTIQIGRVISQSPGAGPSSLSKGGLVTLTISGGKGEQTVPDLLELDPEFARARLDELGLEMVVQEIAQDGFRRGDPVRILRQEPEAGTKLPVGSRVTVFIPIPPPSFQPPNDPGSSLVHAPRLEGLTIAQARRLTAEQGVEMELADAAEDSSTITFQEPPPGDPLPPDRSVLVRTATAAVVPGLTGLSESQARAEVERADLTVGNVNRSYGPVAGEVLGQRPSAGIEVVAGSTVDLVIADPSLSPDAAHHPEPLPTPAFTPAPWVE